MTKLKQPQPLQLLLYAGALYFSGVAVVHALGVKIPGLFVYFNVPSHAYQDRIISFLAFGWSAFFFLTGKKMDSDFIKLILLVGLSAIVALLINTMITNFTRLDTRIETGPFYLIISGLLIYWLFLVFFSRAIRKGKKR